MEDKYAEENIMILHPDIVNAQANVEKLRTELSMLILERDDLLYQECKNIEMAYMLSIGGLEYKAYELECSILRLKRKIELIQAKKNRQENLVLSEIEDILDTEFAEYQYRLNAQFEAMNAALERGHACVLTENETRELKKLYRSIVMVLHPDLNSDLSDEKVQLFYNAVSAYEHADLIGLRAIWEMVASPTIPNDTMNGLALLLKEKERLMSLIQNIKDETAKIKSEYPYTMKALVNNPDAIKRRRNELEEKIGQLSELLVAYTKRLEDILR